VRVCSRGTHADAPLHFIEDGADIEALPLDPFIGPCTVMEVREGSSPANMSTAISAAL
jgi:arylformamidase